MLKRAENPYKVQTAVCIKNAFYPMPFKSGLEYAAPARGTWNIVHTGMLIPGAHEIFVCAAGCLRGVVLTAAEMNAADRFSTIAIRENNVLDGDMEELIIDGVSNIIPKLKEKPKAILLYTSCIHHFMACDLDRVYRELRDRFPDILFTDCYMNPIMRKSGLTPDQLMRRQLYSFLEPTDKDKKSVNIIGSDLPTVDSSDFVQLLQDNGFVIHDITACHTFEDYQKMSKSFLNITTYAAANAAADELNTRLSQSHLYMPVSFSFDEIDAELKELAELLHINAPDTSVRKQAAEAAIEKAETLLNDTPIAIDYTAFSRPLQLAELLIRHGFAVREVYLDSISPEEKESFDYLQKNTPDLLIYPTVHPAMRIEPRNQKEVLAIGQKAAYLTGTSHFVNIVENGGLHGYDGIIRLMEFIVDAYQNSKDASKLITIKGMNAGVCCL